MTIKAKPLTPKAFAPFGQVLMGLGEGPERHEFAARFDNPRPNAKPNFTFLRGKMTEWPVAVRALERHVHSNQVFVPMNGTCYLVAVCPADAQGDPDLARLQAFVATGAQAVNIDTNVWHAPNTVLGAPGEFIMQRNDDGSAADTELRQLAKPIRVDLAGLVPAPAGNGHLDTY